MSKKSIKKVSPIVTVVASILALIVGFAGGFFGIFYFVFPAPAAENYNFVSGDLSVHFLMTGLKNNGDCIYIKAGDDDILIDAGAKYTSIPTINDYLADKVTDNKFEFIIVTHAHEDHYAGFVGDSKNDSLFKTYDVDTIIDFPKTNKTTEAQYTKYITEREAAKTRGASHYTALECWKEENGAQKTYQLSGGCELNILYNTYYEKKAPNNENEYSVCVLITQGEKKFLFTGDLEADGEEDLMTYNNLSEVELFKAGHHGSYTASSAKLLDVIKPKICVVTCTAGFNEYPGTQQNPTPAKNIFPTVDFLKRIIPKAEKIFVTTLGEPAMMPAGKEFIPMNGVVVVISNKLGVSVECSNNNTDLRDTDWYKQYRVPLMA